MFDPHDSPASPERLGDEVKAAVLVALFALVVMGASQALVAPDDVPITREAVAGATSQELASHDLPGELVLKATEIEPPAPTF